MQHVTAFSRPETVPPVSATMPKRKLWILNSWRDLILYVGTPLLIIPLFAVAQARWSAQEIYIFVDQQASGLRGVRDLVCRGGDSFAGPNDRHIRWILRVRPAVYLAAGNSSSATNDARRRDYSFSRVARQFCLDVAHR